MLMRRRGIAIPGVVGDVDEQGSFAQDSELAAAVGVLVANRQAELLSRGAQDRLVLRARRDIVVRQVHQAHPGSNESRYREVLPKRHEMALVVPTAADVAHDQ